MEIEEEEDLFAARIEEEAKNLGKVLESFQRSDTERTDYRGGGGGRNQGRGSSDQGRGRGQSWRPREQQEPDRDRSFNQEYERRDVSERSDQSRGSSSNYFRASGRGRPPTRPFGGRPHGEDVTSQERQSERVPAPPSQHSWASVAQPSTSAQVVENLATMTLETSPRGSTLFAH